MCRLGTTGAGRTPFRRYAFRAMLAARSRERDPSQEVRTWRSSPTSSRPSATRPSCRSTSSRPQGVNLYVKIEAFNPLGSVKDRLALGVIEDAETQRRAQARPDGDRGDQRQHRHRPRDGVRREGLSAGGHHGGDLQRRAPQADALSRRQGHPHAGRRARRRHGQQGRSSWPRSMAGS